jgi:MerR family transcriptional regulator, light-induced transcriptional regulator
MTIYDNPNERPDLERYSDTPVFNMKAVVQRTQVPAPTLRAWERRYELLSPVRGENDYRLYSERDIVLIRWLKQRVDKGMSISHAVSLFRHLYVEQNDPGIQRTQRESDANIPTMRITLDTPLLDEYVDLEPISEAIEQTGQQQLSQTYSDTTTLHADTLALNVVRDRLIDAFNNLDESTANMIMGSLLAVYPVEQLCMELITPTMWHIGTLWTAGRLTVTAEHFASNFFRALLTNLFHTTPAPRDGPLVLVCSAPGEPHELASLMLALFLRRHNIRIVYLGQSIESTSLLYTIRKLSASMLCISLTMPAYLPALINLSKQIEQLPTHRPLFVFGGQVFAHYPGAIAQIRGIYMDGDLKIAVQEIHSQLQECLKKQM